MEQRLEEASGERFVMKQVLPKKKRSSLSSMSSLQSLNNQKSRSEQANQLDEENKEIMPEDNQNMMVLEEIEDNVDLRGIIEAPDNTVLVKDQQDVDGEDGGDNLNHQNNEVHQEVQRELVENQIQEIDR